MGTTRISGQSCGPNVIGGSNANRSRSFSGGPLVVTAEYRTQAEAIITAFNNEITGTVEGHSADQRRVRVYSANNNFTAPVRYTLSHKPLVAVGPVAGGWGGDPHTKLFQNAKLDGFFDPLADADMSPNSCYTMATQAHATNATHYSAFRGFVESGGNFLIQCESITHYEQQQTGNWFQTTGGFNLFGNSSLYPSRPSGTTNTDLAYPNPAMPYTQFIGGFASNQDGAVSEFSLAPGSNLANDAMFAVRNTNSGWTTTHHAAVSKLPTFGGGGGHVFTLANHDYFRDLTTEGAYNTTSLERINGQRMILNAVLIPAQRGGCALQIPLVKGFKRVQVTNDTVPVGSVNPGDQVTWTVEYINDSLVGVPNFQIEDILDAGQTYNGPLTVTFTGGAGTTAAANASYTGVAPNANLLAPGAYLGPGGKITVQIKTTLNQLKTYLNHPTARGTGLPSEGIKTDTVDSQTEPTVAGYTVHCPTANYPAAGGCFPQADYRAWSCPTCPNLAPTGIVTVIPTSAPVTVSGQVITDGGRGINLASVRIQNAVTGEVKTAVTNHFGYFTFTGIPSSQFYLIEVDNRQYVFSPPRHSLMIEDNIAGLTFIGSPNTGTR